MMETLWLASLAFAQFWLAGNLRDSETTQEARFAAPPQGAKLVHQPQFIVDASFQRQVHGVEDYLDPNRKIPGLMGRVRVYTEKFTTVPATGSITVEMYDMNLQAKGTPQLLSVWTFDARVLKTLEKQDNLGVGYSLFLPCDPEAARVNDVKLEVKYTPSTGQAVSAESAMLNLRYIEGLSPAGQTEESAEPPLAPPIKPHHSNEKLAKTLELLGIKITCPSDLSFRMQKDLIDPAPGGDAVAAMARLMVKDGFTFLAANDLEKARFIAIKAKELNVTWNANEPTPDSLLHEIQRKTGGVTPAVKPSDANSMPQVQVNVIVAQLDAATLAKLPLFKKESRQTRCEILADVQEIMGMLQGFRKERKAIIVAEPRIRTLSGQEGILVSGERMPVWWIRHEGEQKVKVCTYKQIGTTIKVVPTVQRDGSVEMKVTAEFSEPSSSDETLFDVSHTETTALIRSGQTFVMASDSMNQKGMKTLVFVTANVIEPVCSQPKTPQAMTFADIVRLSKRGISDDIIIRQMDITNARFRLSVDDILELNSQGVSDNVIRAMQERRPARVSPYVIK